MPSKLLLPGRRKRIRAAASKFSGLSPQEPLLGIHTFDTVHDIELMAR